MKYTAHFVLAFTLLLAGCLTASTSTNSADKSENPFEQQPPFSSEYDDFDDNTTYSAGAIRIGGETGEWEGLHVYVTKTCPGQSFCSSDSLLVTFASTSEDWDYLDYRRLQFIADGERMNFGSPMRRGRTVSGGVVEGLIKVMEPERFETLAQADSLRGRLGSTEFTISRRERERWRALLNESAMQKMMRADSLR